MKIDPDDDRLQAAVEVFVFVLMVCCGLGLAFAHCHPIGGPPIGGLP